MADASMNRKIMKTEKPLSEQVAFKEKLAYGMGDAATAFSAVSVGSFSMYYFTDYVGVSAVLLGSVLLFTRIFDAVTNILMGYVVDRTNTKDGKARPWVKWMILPMFIALVLVFAIPRGMGTGPTIAYITVIINIYYLVYTMSNIPFGTLGTVVSRDPQVRSELNLIRMLGYFAINIILSFTTLWMVGIFGDGHHGNRGWIITMVIYGIIMSIIFWFTYSMTTERVKPVAESTVENGEKEKPLPLGKSLVLLFKNKYWILIFIIMILTWILVNLFGGINVYYAAHILHKPGHVGILNFAFTGALLVGFLCVSFVFRKIGRRRTIFIGLLVIVVSSLAMLLNPTNIWFLGVLLVFRGLGFAPLMGSAYAMLADVIDYGEWKNGIRNEGVTYSGGTFSTTVGSGLASAGIGYVIGLAGYVYEKGATQPESVLTAIKSLYIVAPAVVAVILMIMFYFYNLDLFNEKIAADLKQGKFASDSTSQNRGE
ncbi:MFS transporter [Varibaculum massiliense]|uniref:MFS transporter n=1 Tax=Varibaculum massiliense TaxID=1852372 RepID=UPI0028891239|nr:glycoside-pentoside-hexuronide (GPH):cation symporter [Varibaculum massiliense]